MNEIGAMIGVEARKAVRSQMPLWTGLGGLFMPLGIAFLIFVSKNPAISQKLGLVSAKADLVAYAGTDWSAYLALSGLFVAAGVPLFFVVTWIFGREFADGTLKDMLAMPISRTSIVLAKFIVTAAWSAALAVLMLLVSLLLGALIGLPGGSASTFLHGCLRVLATAAMAIVVMLPFAFLAGVGRGYLLPIGGAILAIMSANVVTLAGWGEYYPWAVPGLYAQAKSPLPAASYWIVVLTGLVGVLLTDWWWKHADQNR